MAWPKGRPQSPEHRAKISAARKPHKQETKDKISASVRASWAARRLETTDG